MNSFNPKERVLGGYMFVFSFIVYVALFLMWPDFLCFGIIQQVLLSVGISIIMGVVMFVCCLPVFRKEGAYGLMFIFLVLTELFSLFIYFLISWIDAESLFRYAGFPLCYVVAYGLARYLSRKNSNAETDSPGLI